MKILVTGASNGMGKGVAKVLAERDNQSHDVILLCRSKQPGQAAVQELSSLTNNDKISQVLADLSRLADVRNAIAEIRGRHDTLDGLFFNAGLGYAAERIETDAGLRIGNRRPALPGVGRRRLLQCGPRVGLRGKASPRPPRRRG